MSGYPGGGYPGNQGGYSGRAPSSGGHPGAPPAGGGYPGAPAHQGGGYPASAPAQNGYPGAPQSGSATPGGYGQHNPVDPNVAQWFTAVDTNKSGQISIQELQSALVNGDMSHFSEEACKLMIKMFDRNQAGTLTITDFAELFKYINQWKATFEGIDKDRNGYIEFNELTQAFQQMGYRFTPTFVQNLLAKYDSRTRRLTLDNLIVSCIQIKRLTDGFRVRDTAMQGQATMSYEDFIGLAMGVHQ